MQSLIVCIFAAVFAAVAAEELKFTDCGKESDVIRISHIGVTPYPPIAKEGFQFTLSVKAKVSRRFLDSKMKLSLRRKVLGFWVPIPCIAGYGSCTYDNGCQLLSALLKEASIPEIPEECPGIDAQDVDMGNSITLPSIPGPLAWLVSGSYRAKGEVTETSTGASIVCAELEGRLVSS